MRRQGARGRHSHPPGDGGNDFPPLQPLTPLPSGEVCGFFPERQGIRRRKGREDKDTQASEPEERARPPTRGPERATEAWRRGGNGGYGHDRNRQAGPEPTGATPGCSVRQAQRRPLWHPALDRCCLPLPAPAWLEEEAPCPLAGGHTGRRQTRVAEQVPGSHARAYVSRPKPGWAVGQSHSMHRVPVSPGAHPIPSSALLPAAAEGHRPASGPSRSSEAFSSSCPPCSEPLPPPPRSCPSRPRRRRTLACQGLARACLPSPRNPGGPAS